MNFLKQLFCRHEWWPVSPEEMVATTCNAGRCNKCHKLCRMVLSCDWGTLAYAAQRHNASKARDMAAEAVEGAE